MLTAVYFMVLSIVPMLMLSDSFEISCFQCEKHSWTWIPSVMSAKYQTGAKAKSAEAVYDDDLSDDNFSYDGGEEGKKLRLFLFLKLLIRPAPPVRSSLPPPRPLPARPSHHQQVTGFCLLSFLYYNSFEISLWNLTFFARKGQEELKITSFQFFKAFQFRRLRLRIATREAFLVDRSVPSWHRRCVLKNWLIEPTNWNAVEISRNFVLTNLAIVSMWR